MKKKNLLLAVLFSLTLSVGATTCVPCYSNVFEINQEKEYKKIGVSQVPADVLKSISAKYAGYSLTEAFVSEDAEYKVVLSKEGNKVTAFYKATGEFVKEA
ncbi:hypothetical protein [Flavobacterium beibuense]|uniref:Lipoprotein n=1 Tax=Flavobacterium beibuense TaxID=657326 RepID=A0A444WHR9_9FLAO|nr:hypothetical protein [Flavobacterium beibuense]RYJ45409.1 hypothetical protein NU09_0001 [Flavobacterium beibuense]